MLVPGATHSPGDAGARQDPKNKLVERFHQFESLNLAPAQRHMAPMDERDALHERRTSARKERKKQGRADAKMRRVDAAMAGKPTGGEPTAA